MKKTYLITDKNTGEVVLQTSDETYLELFADREDLDYYEVAEIFVNSNL